MCDNRHLVHAICSEINKLPKMSNYNRSEASFEKIFEWFEEKYLHGLKKYLHGLRKYLHGLKKVLVFQYKW